MVNHRSSCVGSPHLVRRGKGNGSSYQKLSDSQLSFPRRAVSKTSQKITQLSQNAFKGNTISFVRQEYALANMFQQKSKNLHVQSSVFFLVSSKIPSFRLHYHQNQEGLLAQLRHFLQRDIIRAVLKSKSHKP